MLVDYKQNKTANTGSNLCATWITWINHPREKTIVCHQLSTIEIEPDSHIKTQKQSSIHNRKFHDGNSGNNIQTIQGTQRVWEQPETDITTKEWSI